MNVMFVHIDSDWWYSCFRTVYITWIPLAQWLRQWCVGSCSSVSAPLKNISDSDVVLITNVLLTFSFWSPVAAREPRSQGLKDRKTYHNEQREQKTPFSDICRTGRLHVQKLLPVAHERGGSGSWSAHLLHVGRQQRPGGQEHLLLVHHLRLTGSIVVGAWKKMARGRSGHLSFTAGLKKGTGEDNKEIKRGPYRPARVPLTRREEVHVLAGSVQQQPLKACWRAQTPEKTPTQRLTSGS